MALLDEQLNCSLHGEFSKGMELCRVMENEIAETDDELRINIDNAYINFKQLELRGVNHIRANFNRGWYEMMYGDLLKGFTLMNEGRSVNLWGNKHIGTDKPLWDGSALNGEYVLFVCEAGQGDQIVFIRFVQDITKRGGKVIVVCEDYGLGSVFARMPEVSAVVNYQNALVVYHNYWIPSMAAPVALKTSYEDLSGKPYLTSKGCKFDKLIQSNKLKVGIRWASMPGEGVTNTLGDAYLSRKFPSQLMFDVVMQDHVQIYSLQRDGGVEELPRMSGAVDLSMELQSWEDTADAISNLDLVISSCTSVAHLAAAMGKPTWIIIPLMAYWSWALPGNETPWYDSVKLYRQETYGKWDEPFEKIKNDLSLLRKGKES